MLTLTEYLLARIAHDEATDMGMPHRDSCRQFGGWPGDPESAVECDCGVSARVLVECEAKRALVEDFEILHRDYGVTHDPTTEARRLQARIAMARAAVVYADHPTWREEWRL